MSTTTTAHSSVAARSFVVPGLVVAALVIAVLTFFWFQPAAEDEARLALLEADPTLALPPLGADLAEQVGSESTVASRSWTGEWSITERTDRYALATAQVDQFAEVLYDHMDASAWDVTSVRCQADQLVITGRQVIDGDWATLEFSAWGQGETGQLSVRSAISAVGGSELAVEAEATEIRIDCPAIS